MNFDFGLLTNKNFDYAVGGVKETTGTTGAQKKEVPVPMSTKAPEAGDGLVLSAEAKKQQLTTLAYQSKDEKEFIAICGGEASPEALAIFKQTKDWQAKASGAKTKEDFNKACGGEASPEALAIFKQTKTDEMTKRTERTSLVNAAVLDATDSRDFLNKCGGHTSDAEVKKFNAEIHRREAAVKPHVDDVNTVLGGKGLAPTNEPGVSKQGDKTYVKVKNLNEQNEPVTTTYIYDAQGKLLRDVQTLNTTGKFRGAHEYGPFKDEQGNVVNNSGFN
ncbi:MAG: hypothetical protein WCF95_06615, partial [bacterium]